MTQESTQAKGLAYLKTKKYPNSHLPWALPCPSWTRLLAMGRGAWSAWVQDTVSESKPEKQPLGNNGWELEERMPQLSDLFSGIQGPSILAPRFSRGMEPQITLGGDWKSHLYCLPPHAPAAVSWDHLLNTLESLSQGPLLRESKP